MVVQAAILAVVAVVAVFAYSSASNSTNVPNGSAYQFNAVSADGSSATPTPPVVPPVFEDVDEGSAHAKSIETITRLRITVGTTATTFSPSEPVTRAQMATFLTRFYEAFTG